MVHQLLELTRTPASTMKFLIVLCAALAAASAKPGLLGLFDGNVNSELVSLQAPIAVASKQSNKISEIAGQASKGASGAAGGAGGSASYGKDVIGAVNGNKDSTLIGIEAPLAILSDQDTTITKNKGSTGASKAIDGASGGASKGKNLISALSNNMNSQLVDADILASILSKQSNSITKQKTGYGSGSSTGGSSSDGSLVSALNGNKGSQVADLTVLPSVASSQSNTITKGLGESGAAGNGAGGSGSENGGWKDKESDEDSEEKDC